MNIQEEIFRSIESLRDKGNHAPLDFSTVIIGIEGNQKYKVKIDGVERTVKDGIGLDLKIGSPVWVHAMNGDFRQMYVMCKR